MAEVTAFVMAGGKSTRMGTDKAFLEVQGRSLLANALERAEAAARNVVIVGASSKFSPFGTVIEDLYPDRGPLGGIHAALTASETELNLILGVDMPFVEVRFMKYLISVAGISNAFVTVPCVGGHYEPLCAVYRKEFAIRAEEALKAERNKIDALFAEIPLRVVDDEELADNGFCPSMFRNVNTPEDWDLAREELVVRNVL
jgi:molybdenum cofactor guanylyltransferase